MHDLPYKHDIVLYLEVDYIFIAFYTHDILLYIRISKRYLYRRYSFESKHVFGRHQNFLCWLQWAWLWRLINLILLFLARYYNKEKGFYHLRYAKQDGVWNWTSVNSKYNPWNNKTFFVHNFTPHHFCGCHYLMKRRCW